MINIRQEVAIRPTNVGQLRLVSESLTIFPDDDVQS